MYGQRAYVVAILHQFGHAGGKAAHLGLTAAAAAYRKGAVFDDIERACRDIDDLAPLGHDRLWQWQIGVAACALARQWLVDCFSWLGGALERAAFVIRLGVGLVVGRLAQRIGLAPL